MTLHFPASAFLLSGALVTYLAVTAPASAAALAVADASGGYADRVLDKVIAVWAPPSSLKGDFTVRLRVGLNEKGQVQECTHKKKSGMDALDVSACTAVRKAAPFGTPPYGLPIEVHLAFWTGTPRAAVSPVAAATAPVVITPAVPDQQAAAAEERARRRAEAIVREAEAGNGKADIPAPAADGLTAEEMNLELNSGPARMQDKYGPKYRKYFSRVAWALRNATFIPAETVPGTYYATVRLALDDAGNIKKSSLVESSGDKLLDRFVLQGVRRAGKVDAPPQGLSREVDVTLTLVR
ncbi:MAG: TonB family protein [Desulfovibrio sp.]|nr:TonB family protein [Desulfovibrio sp.]